MNPGRNDPCPCGSGKKYKRCCGERSAEAASASAPAAAPAGRLSPGTAESHFQAGYALLERGDAQAAAARFRQALALAPDFAEAHGNLANALTDLGQWQEALTHYWRMVDLKPGSPEAHNNLGNALLAGKQFAEAANCYRRALALRPNSAGALVNLGNALRETGHPDDAIAVCRRALELNPEIADAHVIIGNAQFDLGLLDEAAGAYASALKLDRSSVQAHLAMGKVMRQTGAIEAAALQTRQVLDFAPQSAEALALLGEIQGDYGRFAEAERLFRQALEIAPHLPEAWAGLARYRKMNSGDAAWLSGAQRVAASPLPTGQRVNLLYAIGKYFDDVADFEHAFATYRQANELQKRDGTRYEPARSTQRVDDIMRLYNPAWLERASLKGSQSVRPVFIVGMPRSGTTLAEQILASHPGVFGAGELRFWHTATVRHERTRRPGEQGFAALSGLAREYLGQLAALSADAARVVDKMPANYLNLGLIHAVFPNARIIHMRRNPLDTALSIYFQVFSNTHSYANDLGNIAHHYAQYARLMRHWHEVLPAGTILDVSYEQLVADPEPQIRALVDFCRLDWDARCLDFHQTERAIATASNWQVRQKISPASAGRWRRYASHLDALRVLEAV